MAGASASGIAERLLAHFGSAGRLLSGCDEGEDIAPAPIIQQLAMIRELMACALKDEISRGPVLPNSRALTDYLIATQAHARREQLRVLYLDRSNRLLADEIAADGTVHAVFVFPREVMRRALQLDATGLILVHNHPSGSLEPSAGDLALTRSLIDACKPFEIVIHDHLIVSGVAHASMRALGML